MVPFSDMIRNKLGLELQEITQEDSASTGFQPGKGLLVHTVEKDSPAEKAQLLPGFLVTAVDGESTGDLMMAGNALSVKQRGDRVRLSVVVPRRLANNFVQFSQGTVELQTR